MVVPVEPVLLVLPVEPVPFVEPVEPVDPSVPSVDPVVVLPVVFWSVEPVLPSVVPIPSVLLVEPVEPVVPIVLLSLLVLFGFSLQLAIASVSVSRLPARISFVFILVLLVNCFLANCYGCKIVAAANTLFHCRSLFYNTRTVLKIHAFCVFSDLRRIDEIIPL